MDGAPYGLWVLAFGIRAALVTAMNVGIPLLQDHVSRALGVDMFEPEGERLVAPHCSTSIPTQFSTNRPPPPLRQDWTEMTPITPADDQVPVLVGNVRT